MSEVHEILKILIENQEERFSIRKLSQIRKINYKSAYNALMRLEREGIVTLEKIGNTINCSFNRKFNPLVFDVEYRRRAELLKNKNFKIISSRLNELNSQFIVLLFGSFVKKTTSKHSDIDLLVVTENKNGIEQAIDLIPLSIHATIITNKEFIEMAKSKEFSVVSESIKKNIVLVGIEDYYRLLENVR